MTFISSALVSILSVIVIPYVPDEDLLRYSFELQLGCLLLFANTLLGVQNGALAGVEAFRTIAWVNSLLAICTFIFIRGDVHSVDEE
jgi:O-antigen/teichoic acid export membrane protein